MLAPQRRAALKATTAFCCLLKHHDRLLWVVWLSEMVDRSQEILKNMYYHLKKCSVVMLDILRMLIHKKTLCFIDEIKLQSRLRQPGFAAHECPAGCVCGTGVPLHGGSYLGNVRKALVVVTTTETGPTDFQSSVIHKMTQGMCSPKKGNLYI